MDNQYSIFDMLPEDDPMRIAFQPQKATDWKWSMRGGLSTEKRIESVLLLRLRRWWHYGL